MLRDLQNRFAAAMVDPTASLPPELLPPSSGPGLERRFTVHRATYGKSLAQVTAAAFPSVAAILGPTRIERAGIAFCTKHPPRKAALWQYGGEFPDFLETFEPLQNIPYLPDLARLDWACHLAWFAEDASRLDPSRLTQIAPERIARITFIAHPAARIVASPFPIDSIKRALANRTDDSEKIRVPEQGETALVTRPHADVSHQPIQPPQAELVVGLLNGVPIGEALDHASRAAATAGESAPPDLQAALGLLLATGALQDLVDA